MCRLLLALFCGPNSTHYPGGITNALTGYRVSKVEHSVTISCGTIPHAEKRGSCIVAVRSQHH